MICSFCDLLCCYMLSVSYNTVKSILTVSCLIHVIVTVTFIDFVRFSVTITSAITVKVSTTTALIVNVPVVVTDFVTTCVLSHVIVIAIGSYFTGIVSIAVNDTVTLPILLLTVAVSVIVTVPDIDYCY